MSEPCKQVELLQVIRTTLLRNGSGKTSDDPVRRVIQYWSLDGELLATVDDLGPTHCNGIGHIVWPSSSACERCGAHFDQHTGRMP